MIEFRGEVNLNIAGLRKLAVAALQIMGGGSIVASEFQATIDRALVQVQAATPGSSRKLASGWKSRLIRKGGKVRSAAITHDLTGKDGSNLLNYLEKGTKPHTIEPRTRKVLRFSWASGGSHGSITAVSGGQGDGSVHYAAVVQHPGTKPYRMRAIGIKSIEDDLPGLIYRLGKRTSKAIKDKVKSLWRR